MVTGQRWLLEVLLVGSGREKRFYQEEDERSWRPSPHVHLYVEAVSCQIGTVGQ